MAEGDRVAIVAAEPAEPIQLTAEQEAELVTAEEDLRHGKYLDGQDLLAELRTSTGSEPSGSKLAARRQYSCFDQDTVVLPHHSRDFAAALEEHGCEVLFLEVPGEAHRDEIVGPYQKEVADFLTRESQRSK